MPSATTTAAPASGTCAANLYDTPVRDIACAMPHSDKNIDMMTKCCKDADIVSYYDDCGIYCLALGQSSEDLSKCLYDAGAKYENVFCRDGGDASATATGNTKPLPSADTEVVKGGKGGDDKDDDGDDKDGDDEDGDDDDSAAGVARPQHTTLAGVVVGTLLFTATAFGGMLL